MIKKIDKIILLVGLMGSGNTSVGKRLAKKLNLPFVDGDQEIEKAAGLSLVDVLKCFGEEEYRAGEKRVMKRLLQGAPCVLASGGGSFVAEQTRELAKIHGITAPPDANTALFSKVTIPTSKTNSKNISVKNIPIIPKQILWSKPEKNRLITRFSALLTPLTIFFHPKKPLKQRFFCVWRNILCRFGFPIGFI